jgi:hypothetical protein
MGHSRSETRNSDCVLLSAFARGGARATRARGLFSETGKSFAQTEPQPPCSGSSSRILDKRLRGRETRPNPLPQRERGEPSWFESPLDRHHNHCTSRDDTSRWESFARPLPNGDEIVLRSRHRFWAILLHRAEFPTQSEVPGKRQNLFPRRPGRTELLRSDVRSRSLIVSNSCPLFAHLCPHPDAISLEKYRIPNYLFSEGLKESPRS